MDGRSEGLESEFEEKWFGGMNLEVWESRECVKWVEYSQTSEINNGLFAADEFIFVYHLCW